MTCPRKYCLIDTCTSDADAEYHEARRVYIEPDDNVDTEEFHCESTSVARSHPPRRRIYAHKE